MADYSPLTMRVFEVAPDSPISMHNVHVDMEQFLEASPMKHAYCEQISEKDFEQQATNATSEALAELIDYIDTHPEQFKQTMRKRKKEELENAGLSSFIKCRFMSKLQGDKYTSNLVTDSEYRERKDEVQRGMLKVHAYAQEAKKHDRRYNTRLAAKQLSSTSLPSPRQHHDSPSSPSGHQTIPRRMAKGTGSAPVPPPPPPPCPPPVLTMTPSVDHCGKRMPLGDRTNAMTLLRPSIKALKRSGSNASMSSMASVQEELLSANPLKRLRATHGRRSPGGTPVKAYLPRDSLGGSDSLSSILIRIMDEKFKNVRSPSPARNETTRDETSLNVSQDFSP